MILQSKRQVRSFAIFVIILIAALGSSAARAANEVRDFNIGSQRLEDALIEFSIQADVVVTARPEAVAGRIAPAVRGTMPASEALRRLLSNSGLEYRVSNSGSIIVGESLSGRADSFAANEGGGAERNSTVELNDDNSSRETGENSTNNNRSTGEQGVEMIPEIMVTGSRIPRAGFDTLQPAFQVTSDYIDERGFSNVAAALNENPAFGFAATSNSGGQQANTVGQNFVNAFGLGSQRSLTLINGRRVVAQSSPTIVNSSATIGAGNGIGQQVDLNIIPTAMIDRVETVYVGGAPIYGSDAIAATVNVILKDDFDGVSTDVQYGNTTRGDAQHYRVRSLLGTGFGDGRGNAIVAIEYVDVSDLDGSARDVVRSDYTFCANPANTGPSDGIPNRVHCADGQTVWQVPNSGMILRNIGFASQSPSVTDLDMNGVLDPDEIAAGEGNVLFDEQGSPLMFGVDGSLITWNEANTGDRYNIFFTQGADSFNNELFTSLPETETLITPLERFLVSTNAHYDLADNVQFFNETLFAHTEATDLNNQPAWSTLAFAPGISGPLRINATDNPFISGRLRDVLELNGIFDPSLVDDPATPDVDESDQYFWLTRSNIDIVGGSPNARRQDVFRVVAGLQGDFGLGGHDWNWNAYYSFGKTNATASSSIINGARYAAALDAVVDPSTGETVCRVQLDPPGSVFDNSTLPPEFSDIANCVPFDPFGIQELTPEQRRYLIQSQLSTTDVEQQVSEANISGTIMDLPAGSWSLASGITYRRESASFRHDQAQIVGFDPALPSRDVIGAFTTKEVYAETLFPLIGDGELFSLHTPLINSFSVEGAIRYVDNSLAGTDVTWTLGGRLRLDLPLLGNGVLIRGNVTQAIRSPSIAELFLPITQITTTAQDPCDADRINDPNAPSIRRMNCINQLTALVENGSVVGNDANNNGVIDEDERIDANMDGSLSEAEALAFLNRFQSVIENASQLGTTGGNQNLTNEITDSRTIGLIITPPQWPGFMISADWVSIPIDDAISNLSATQLLRACYDNSDSLDSPICGRFDRASNFDVFRPQTGFGNAARLRFRGFVGSLRWSTPLDRLFGNAPGDLDISTDYFKLNKYEQTVAGADLDIFARERHNESTRVQLNLRYSLNRFSVLWNTQYRSSGIRSNEETAEAVDVQRRPSIVFHNVTASYKLSQHLTARVIFNNVFDTVDDIYNAASASNGGRTDFFDPIGGRYVVGLTANWGF